MNLESHIKHVHGPKEVSYKPEELVVVCLVRDGRLYLRSFVEHYFGLGVKHIVFMDNDSTDGTVAAAMMYDNITVLQTRLPFREYKNALRRYLVNRFGRGRWILYVDIDELFDYPYSSVVGLGSLLRFLTGESYTAVVAQMLNMLPERPVSDAPLVEDEPLKELHRFYDVSNVMRNDYRGFDNLHQLGNTLASEEVEVYRGGINKSLFGHNHLLTKHPLMFVDNEIRPFAGSEHWVGGARVADITCVLYHYTFTGDLYEKALRAVREESYAQSSRKYKMLLEKLEHDPEMQPKLETAQELGGVDDLVGNQFLVVSGKYMSLVDAEERRAASGGVLQTDKPRKLVEAYSKASARARAEANRARELERRVVQLEKSLDNKQKALDNKQKALDNKQETLANKQKALDNRKRALDNKQKALDNRKRALDNKRRRIRSLEREKEALKSSNQQLRQQIESIRASRTFQLLEKLGRLRARGLPRRS